MCLFRHPPSSVMRSVPPRTPGSDFRGEVEAKYPTAAAAALFDAFADLFARPRSPPEGPRPPPQRGKEPIPSPGPTPIREVVWSPKRGGFPNPLFSHELLSSFAE